MLISEIKGRVQGLSFDSERGIWINVGMNQVVGRVLECFSAEIPLDTEILNGKDICKFLCNKRVKVTVETIDN